MALSHAPPLVPWSVVFTASLVGAVIDVRRRRIPNWLTAPVLCAGLVWSAWVIGRWGLLDGVLGCLLLSTPYVVLFLFAGGGAGDAKLMGAIGAWLGVGYGSFVLVSVCVCGAILGIVYAIACRRFRSVVGNVGLVSQGVLALVASRQGIAAAEQIVPRPDNMTKMPYGLAIFAGTVGGWMGVFLWKWMTL